MNDDLSLAQVIALIKGIGGTGGSGSGGSGTTDYNLLENKPTINGTALVGALTSKDLGLELTKEQVNELVDKEIELYFWEGLEEESTMDENAISLITEINEKINNGKTILLIVKKVWNGKMAYFLMNKNTAKEDDNNLRSYDSLNSDFRKNLDNDGTTRINGFLYNIYWLFTDGAIPIIGVSSTNSINISNEPTILDVDNKNDTVYFKPQFKSQPVSKGYLDEKVPKTYYLNNVSWYLTGNDVAEMLPEELDELIPDIFGSEENLNEIYDLVKNKNEEVRIYTNEGYALVYKENEEVTLDIFVTYGITTNSPTLVTYKIYKDTEINKIRIKNLKEEEIITSAKNFYFSNSLYNLFLNCANSETYKPTSETIENALGTSMSKLKLKWLNSFGDKRYFNVIHYGYRNNGTLINAFFSSADEIKVEIFNFLGFVIYGTINYDSNTKEYSISAQKANLLNNTIVLDSKNFSPLVEAVFYDRNISIDYFKDLYQGFNSFSELVTAIKDKTKGIVISNKSVGYGSSTVGLVRIEELGVDSSNNLIIFATGTSFELPQYEKRNIEIKIKYDENTDTYSIVKKSITKIMTDDNIFIFNFAILDYIKNRLRSPNRSEEEEQRAIKLLNNKLFDLDWKRTTEMLNDFSSNLRDERVYYAKNAEILGTSDYNENSITIDFLVTVRHPHSGSLGFEYKTKKHELEITITKNEEGKYLIDKFEELATFSSDNEIKEQTQLEWKTIPQN